MTHPRNAFRFLVGPAAALVLLAGAWAPEARAEPKTVCTVTINSSDEKDAFQRHLPRGDYRFVELVQAGQSDWLGAACRRGVRCDSLIISGHFDDGAEFYTDSFDKREFLTMHELQQASCSASCSGLFTQLKDVYLFGCNTLKTAPRHIASAEVTRSLMRAGQPRTDAERVSALLSERYGQSNRDRLRHVFKDVPVLYGFSSKAPLGRSAGPLLERYFQSAPAGEIGSGHASTTLLGLFGPSSMVADTGLTGADPHAVFRQDLCSLADAEPTVARKLAFVHQVLQRDVTEVRMLLDQLEHFVASITPAQRLDPAVLSALAEFAGDVSARERYLAFSRDTDEATVQVRMAALARGLGWLTPAQERAEFLQMITSRMAQGGLGRSEVDLICETPADATSAPQLLATGVVRPDVVMHAAVLACLGNAAAHGRTLRALSSSIEEEVEIAQVYLRHRPLAGVGELRALAAGISQMKGGAAQVRALQALAGQRLADAPSLQEIARLFPLARSLDAQRAIAGILVRADYRLLSRADLARSLQQHRLKSTDGSDVIDLLIRLLRST
jgi:hypothetical protein